MYRPSTAAAVAADGGDGDDEIGDGSGVGHDCERRGDAAAVVAAELAGDGDEDGGAADEDGP